MKAFDQKLNEDKKKINSLARLKERPVAEESDELYQIISDMSQQLVS